MSSSNGSNVDQSENHSRTDYRGNWCSRGNWSGINIAAMVIGFVLFWPIGLFLLYWILTGRNVRTIPRAFRSQFSRLTGFCDPDHYAGYSDYESNVVFNEYQQTQFDRINEIKDEIRERSRRFNEYRTNAKRRADEEEFNNFMADTPISE